MTLLNTFDPKTSKVVTYRLNKLSHSSVPLWGKMNVAQMLPYLNVT